MSFEIDPRFKATSVNARKRSRSRSILRIGVVVGCLGVLVGGGFLVNAFLVKGTSEDTSTEIPTENSTAEAGAIDAEALAMVADTERPVFDARATFIDLSKDPLVLNFETGTDGPAGHTRPTPTGLDQVRTGPELILIEDALVVQSRRLITTLPSSRADFAYFQSARSEAIDLLDTSPVATQTQDAEAGDLVTVDGEDGSWGDLIVPAANNGTADEATFIETTIENTTSVISSVTDDNRFTLYRDDVIITQIERPLIDMLAQAGLGRVQARLSERAAIRLLGLGDNIDAGVVLATRIRTQENGAHLLQLSVYAGSDYIGTIAQVAPGNFETGADPWLGEDLVAQSREAMEEVVLQRDVRLLDGIYSAAIRNGMPSSLVGEMMVMLSRHEDLERFASIDDTFTAIFSTEPGLTGNGAGQLLYAGVTGSSGEIDCYVVLSPSRENFECYHEREAISQLGGIGAGMLVPVNGTKTSSFGPRMHPVLSQMRNHNGVDWGAPTGTPVIAAADGTISRANVNGGYGNVVYIDHSGGRQTRYAHLNAFADGIRNGVPVSAGDVIGYVGTTGRSTGPHLHFELRVHDEPVDPLTYTGPPNVVTASSTGSAAVEALVNQIIKVESAGNANAANPNSTARGLGQFIESTWLRMIDVYRPDLSGLSRADKLALRFDPELSREMVRNLAREGEAYLRNRGHEITAGRLYLAHFLGAQGAHVALSADPNRSVRDIMGPDVVNANGFLRGRNIAWLWNWAERKMASTGGAVVAPPAPLPQIEPISEETAKFIEIIDELVETL